MSEERSIEAGAAASSGGAGAACNREKEGRKRGRGGAGRAFGWRSPVSFPVPPSVTPCSRRAAGRRRSAAAAAAPERTRHRAGPSSTRAEGRHGRARKPTRKNGRNRTWRMLTWSPTTAVSPITTPVPWSMRTPAPTRAAGWMSTVNTSDTRDWSVSAITRWSRRQRALAMRYTWRAW